MKRVMKRTGFVLFVAAAAGLLTLQAADNKDIYTQKDEKDVLQIEDQWAAALQNGDTATLERLLASNYTFVDADGKTLSKAQEIARYKSGEVKFDSFAVSDRNVIIYIGGAIVTGKTTVKGKYKNE